MNPFLIPLTLAILSTPVSGRAEPNCWEEMKSVRDRFARTLRRAGFSIDELSLSVPLEFSQNSFSEQSLTRLLLNKDLTLDEVSQAYTDHWESLVDTWKGLKETQPRYAYIRRNLAARENRRELFEALEVISIFERAIAECSVWHSSLNIPCSKFVTRDQWPSLVKQGESYSSGKLSSLFLSTAVENLRPQFAASNPRLSVQSTLVSNSLERVDLTFAVKRGPGFADEEAWKAFFKKFKKANEEFWRGRFRRSDNGRWVSINLILYDSTHAAEAIVIDLYGQDGAVADRSGILFGLHKKYDPVTPATDAVILVHELGHVLGFLDTYGAYLDEKSCTFGYNNHPSDIMTANPSALQVGIQPEQLEALYRTHVLREIDPTVEEYWDRFLPD